MDDLFLQTSLVVSTELLLQRCTFVLSWARMSFRASKSRSIVIQNGRVLDVSPFSFDNEAIPSIHSNPVRFLGRTIDVSLCDREVVSTFKDRVLDGLELINKSFHRGTLRELIFAGINFRDFANFGQLCRPKTKNYTR